MSTIINKEVITEIVSRCYTIADVCRELGWQPRGGNYRVVHRYIKDYNLDTSHFTGQRTNIGNKLNSAIEKPVNEYLKKDSNIKASALKWKLFSNGLKEYKCEICGCNKWNDSQISLQLHHINGDDTDNRLENLQILCPNCHSQTDNFCGKNVLKTENFKKRHYCKSCHKEMTANTPSGLCDECYELMVNNKLTLKRNSNCSLVRIYSVCPECGKDIWYDSKLCVECSKKKQRKVERPSKEELNKLIHEKSFVSIGKMYGVSDASIKKWCKLYGLPHRKKDLK